MRTPCPEGESNEAIRQTPLSLLIEVLDWKVTKLHDCWRHRIFDFRNKFDINSYDTFLDKMRVILFDCSQIIPTKE